MSEQTPNPLTLAINALRWYAADSRSQYGNSELALYDEAAEILTKRKEFADFLVSKLGVNPGRVLELAAGSGLVSSVLKSRLKDVTFLDLSLPALDLLKNRVRDQGEPVASASIVNADFTRQPFATRSFDTIVCVGGYRYVTPNQKKQFWAETTRILKVDGKLFFAQFKPRNFSINGSVLGEDLGEYGLESVAAYKFSPKIEIGPLAIKTGYYELAQYDKIKW